MSTSEPMPPVVMQFDREEDGNIIQVCPCIEGQLTVEKIDEALAKIRHALLKTYGLYPDHDALTRKTHVDWLVNRGHKLDGWGFRFYLIAQGLAENPIIRFQRQRQAREENQKQAYDF